MKTVYDYVTKYPFPAINMETITKAVNTVYGTDYSESNIEYMLCTFFILEFDRLYDNGKSKNTKKLLLDFYNVVNINEPCCAPVIENDCTTCSSFKLCIQAPEVYHPNKSLEDIKEFGTDY